MVVKEIFPQWVVVDNQIHRVSDYSHLKPESRPKAICPRCKNTITMKLGRKRVHHYAHRTNVVCDATKPETALHLNTKYYIYEQLKSGNKLFLEKFCSNGCGRTQKITWLQDWESVKIEPKIGSFRPDIAIIGNNETICAIEISVTHSVEDDKKAFYKLKKIGWLEIEAHESIYEGEKAWRIDQPLPFAVCSPALTKWICWNCNHQLQKEKEFELKARQLNEQRRHNYWETTQNFDFLRDNNVAQQMDHEPQKLTFANPTNNSTNKRKGICKKCGRITTDWLSFDGKTGKCICKKCYPTDEMCNNKIPMNYQLPLD